MGSQCDLKVSNVTDWSGRPQRARKKPKTYWEEFVETDAWFTKELVRDIPEEELYAACFDENLEDDEGGGESGEELLSSDDEGPSYAGSTGSLAQSDGSYEPTSDGESDDGSSSDDVSGDESGDDDSCGSGSDGAGTPARDMVHDTARASTTAPPYAAIRPPILGTPSGAEPDSS